MNCPQCEDDCWRDEADVGVGIIYGPWNCSNCGWSEDSTSEPMADLSGPCRMCKVIIKVVVPAAAYKQWKGGDLIQRALPMISAGKREFLINQTCEKCFDELFAE